MKQLRTRYAFVMMAMCIPFFAKSQTASPQTLISKGDSLFAVRDFKEAIIQYDSALLAPDLSTEDHLKVRTNLMISLLTTGDVLPVFDAVDSILQANQRHFGEQHVLTARAYYLKGLTLRINGERWSEARVYLEKCLRISIALYGETDEFVADCYHQLALYYSHQSKVDSSLLLFHKSRAIWLRDSVKYVQLIASSYVREASSHMFGSQFTEAMKDIRIGLELAEASKDTTTLEGAMSIAARISYEKGDYASAIDFINQSIEMIKSQFGASNFRISSSLGNLGQVYLTSGEPEKGLIILFEALGLYKIHHGEDHPRYALCLANIGAAYLGLQQYDLAVRYGQQALDLLAPVLPANHPYMGQLFQNMTAAYSGMGQSDSIRFYQDKALDIARVAGEDYRIELAVNYKAIGTQAMIDGDFPSAKQFLNQCLEVLMDYDNRPLNTQTYNLLTEVYLHENAFDKSLEMIRLAIFYNDQTRGEAVSQVLGPDQWVSKQEGIHTLTNWISLLRKQYEVTGDHERLLEGVDLIRVADELVLALRQHLTNHKDKLEISRLVKQYFQQQMSLYQYLEAEFPGEWLDEIFMVMENSQSFLLRNSVEDRLAKTFANIPESLLDLERELKLDKAYQLSLAEDSGNDTTMQTNAWKQVFQIEVQLDSLIEVYRVGYPDYFRLRYDASALKVEDVQEGLQDDQAILDYFKTQSSLQVLVITKQDVLATKIPIDSTFDRLTQDYLDSFLMGTAEVGFEEKFERFTQSASAMYETVLQPVMALLPESTEHLIIIPPDRLAHVPWGVLLQSNPETKDFASLNYLLRDYSISYAYATGLFLEEQEYGRHKVRNARVLAIAPEYGDPAESLVREPREVFRSELVPLIWNKSEAEQVSEIMGGATQVGTEATEFNFKQQMDDYGIIHLAGHALVDNVNPMRSKLYFSQDTTEVAEDGELNFYELLNMEIPAQMVVLSACETGLGKLRNGEGVMSLGRAFSYAGVPSVMTSFWSVEDQSSADLMKRFYQHLAAGETKDDALRLSKLSFLEETIGAKNHPYYWAGFGVLGNTQPITQESHWKWIGILLVLLVLITGYFIRSRSQAT